MRIIAVIKSGASRAAFAVKGNARKACAVGGGLALTTLAHAQAATPVETIEGATSSAQGVWIGIAGLSATAFVFGMVIAFGKKAKK